MFFHQKTRRRRCIRRALQTICRRLHRRLTSGINPSRTTVQHVATILPQRQPLKGERMWRQRSTLQAGACRICWRIVARLHERWTTIQHVAAIVSQSKRHGCYHRKRHQLVKLRNRMIFTRKNFVIDDPVDEPLGQLSRPLGVAAVQFHRQHQHACGIQQYYSFLI